MMQKRGVLIISIFIALLIFAPFVSASFWDWITGKVTTPSEGGKPDLIITDVTVPDSIMENQTFVMSVTVKNIGTANKSEGHATIAVVNPLTTPRCVHNSVWSSLAPSEAITKTFTFACIELEKTNYGLPTGTYELNVIIDYDNAFDELDETNNEFKKTIVVGKKEVAPTPAVPFKKEQVKCIFTNSNSFQKCYTADGKFGCSGTGTCIAEVSGNEGTKLTWKSSCGGEAYTIIDGVEGDYVEFKCEPAPTEPIPITPTPALEIVKEQVKCIFANSNSLQKCYTDDGRFGCSGTGTCVADAYGEKGTRLAWKSSCVGESITIIDGNSEYAEFKCEPSAVTPSAPAPTPAPAPSLIEEQVRCTFGFSNSQSAAQKCYTDDGRFGCSVDAPVAQPAPEESEEYKTFIATLTEEMRMRLSAPLKLAIQLSCLVNVSGKMGEKLTWKSSCGSYAYTVIDGSDENAAFLCLPSSNVSIEEISGKGFRYASWQCYSGGAYIGTGQMAEDIARGIPIEQRPCWSYDKWYEYANDFCANMCETQNIPYPPEGIPCGCIKNEKLGTLQCGIMNLAFTGECYIEGGIDTTDFVSLEIKCQTDEECTKGIIKLCEKEGALYCEKADESKCIEGQCMGKEVKPKPVTYTGPAINVLHYIYKDDCPECKGMDEAVDKVAQTLGIKVKKIKEPAEKSTLSVSYVAMGGAPMLVYTKMDSNGIVKQCTKHGNLGAEDIIKWMKTCEGTEIGRGEAATPSEPMIICKDSCPLGSKCYPFGYRKGGKYCSIDGAFNKQLVGDEACENNFECDSNVCVNDKCISSNLIKKIIDWFKKLFGMD